MGEIMRSMLDNWGVVVAGMGMVIMTTVSFYMITAYAPTFGKEVLHLSSLDALVVTVCVGISISYGCRCPVRCPTASVAARC